MADRSSVRSGRFLLMLCCFGLSSLGSGLVLPLTAIYIASELRLGSGAVGAYFATMAATSMVVVGIAGRLGDRVGARVTGSAGLALMATGYALLGAADGSVSVLASAVGIGVGLGLFQSAMVPTIAAVVGAEERRRAFALRYLAMNVGIGLGAALGGAVLGLVHGVGSYRLLYALDAATFVPLAAIFAWLGPGRLGRAEDRPTVTYRALLTRRPLVLLLLVQAVVAVFAYAQFEATVPLILHRSMGLAAQVVALVVAVNTIGVVVLQEPMVRLLQRRSESASLAFSVALWASAFGVGAVSSLVTGPGRIVLVAGFSLVFAAAEAAYATAAQPLLVALTPAEGLSRASALSSLARSSGRIGGPAIGVSIVAASTAAVAWTAFAAVLTAGVLVALALSRTLADRARLEPQESAVVSG
jgi:MFS family permease